MTLLLIYDRGNHALHFSADQNPILENVAIFKISETEINYLPEENNPAQDGDRRQWLTIIPVGVLIKNLNIKATAKNYPQDRDDDDIKIIIDGTIQENEADKSHKNWYWCGRILDGQEKEFNRELNLENGLHYIELWADKSPVLSFIKIILTSQEQPTEPGKRIPTVEDPEWTEDFKDDSEQMILARAVFGEARSLSEKGKIGDPTDGANHYFSDNIDPPYWTKTANAEFKIKIGNTLFYDLKKNINGGFVNIKKAILVFIVVISVGLGCLYLAVKINNKLDCTPKLSGVHVAEHYKHFFINPKTDEVKVAYFDKDGNFLEMKQVTHNGYPKYNLNDFYGTETFGYFQDLHKRNEPLSENEQEYYKNYVSLFIKDNEYAEPREIYRGDVHTSSWEWLSNKNVRVYVSAGSGVRVYRDIDINTTEPFIASDHAMSEDWITETF